MIDTSDGDFALYGIGGVVGLVLAVILFAVAMANSEDCSKRACPNEHETARLLDHECVCVAPPGPRK